MDIKGIARRPRGLSPPEELELLSNAKGGDRRATLILENVYLIAILAVAKRCRGHGFGLGTMMAIGQQAFVAALLDYNPKSQESFDSFAIKQVARAIASALPGRVKNAEID